MSSLNRDQLQVLSRADAILNDVLVDLILAETDEEWKAIRDKTIEKMIAIGEPEVFKVYQKKWNDVAAVIVPLVMETQIRNGIKPYTEAEYADRLAGITEGQQP